MFHLVHGPPQGALERLPDLAGFVSSLRRPEQHPSAGLRGLFRADEDLFVARAPGRLDLMGGIADYSGSLVLQWPLRVATLVALQRDPERRLRIVSGPRVFEMPLADFDRGGALREYDAARAWFRGDTSRTWAGYVAGIFLALARERGVEFRDGARILVQSNVPEGKGVGSSAALEAATMVAAIEMWRPGSAAPDNVRDLALLCQRAENLVVGAPCGVMDHMTALGGQEGRLLTLLCQPAELQQPVPLPADLAVWGIDSGIRHAVSGADYTGVRVGAFMGYRILTELTGRDWGGYLANVGPSAFAALADQIPERISGRDFLDRYGGTSDPVTRVEPDREYAVRTPTAHPIHEHARVKEFRHSIQAALKRKKEKGKRKGVDKGGATAAEHRRLGELMFASHASYSACGLGSEGTDAIVDAVRKVRLKPDPTEELLFGAKITGGGSGGTVAVLGTPEAGGAVERIAAGYRARAGRGGQVFAGSSPGALHVGCLRLAPAR